MKKKKIILISSFLVLSTLSSCVRFKKDNSKVDDSTTNLKPVETESETKKEESTSEETINEVSLVIYVNGIRHTSNTLSKNSDISIILENIKGEYDTKYYEFNGFYTDYNCTNKYESNIIESNLTLYATYKEIKYVNVSFNIDGLISKEIIKSNSKVTKPVNPIKEGYTFKNWFTNELGIGDPFDFDSTISSDLTIYAIFVKDPIYYTITFDIDGVTSTNSILESNKVVEPTKPEKSGYTFKGWYLNQDGSGEAFDFNTNINSNLTLYAIFEKDAYYTVTYNIDGVISSETVKGLSKVNTPATPIKDGYQFVGWYTNIEGSGNPFDFNTPITKNITLYAIFKANTYYTVTFDIEGVLTTTSVLENDKVSEPQTPSKDGYLFKGWYEDRSGDGETFDFNCEIISNLTLYAVFKEKSDVIYASYEEGMYIEFSDTTLNGVDILYKNVNDSTYKSIDKELIRLDSSTNTIRADIVGLEKGNYTIKYTKSDSTTYITEEIDVENFDRSGYAHFNYSSDSTSVDVSKGIGAYTNSGVLKSNALVVYVSEETKNSIQAKIGGKTYTGLVAILQAQSKSSVALDIRIIGTISAATWNKIDYKVNGVTSITPENVVGVNGKALSNANYTEEEIISNGFNTLETTYTKLNGLTNKIKYDSSKSEFDSYYNMCDISNASNVTVEGIGTDATIYQWGFTWKSCSSIEVRNLTFDDYTEDACSFEGSSDSTTLSGFKSGHIWIHNNQFNEGKNNWDVCNEQDKHEGDGATDFKKNAFITVSYNHYIKNHKTGLVGGDDNQHTACITFHHNYYDSCTSRLPLARQANMHMYNNYYYNSSSISMSIRANGYAFVENNYFEGGKNPYQEYVNSKTKLQGYVKAYNNEFVNTTTSGNDYYNTNNVSSRDEAVTNTNIYGQTFDTDSTIFYYDDTNMVSNVEKLTSATKAKEDCIKYAGVHKNSNSSSSTTPSVTTYTVNVYDGTNLLDRETIEINSTFSKTYSKDGYNFIGLYTDSNFTSVYDTSSKITTDLNLYAKFEVIDDKTSSDSESLKTTYTMNASDLTKALDVSNNINLDSDYTYNTVFTLSKVVKVIPNSCISSNKKASYYNSSSDYSNVIFIDVANDYTGNLDIVLSSNDSKRIMYIYNINDMSKALISGYSGTISLSNLTSGRYVVVFTEGYEIKISSISLSLSKVN